MLHVRVVSPAAVTEQLADRLESAPGVQNVLARAGAARRPAGDAVEFDVHDGAANPVFSALRELGLDRDGVICVERVDAALTAEPVRAGDHGALRQEIAPVWEMVEATIRQGEAYAPSFYILLAVAGLIGAVGLLTNSQILIVGAMVVGPEYDAIIGVALGLSRRVRAEVRDGLLALCWGFLAAIVVTLLFGLSARASGKTPAAFLEGVRPVADLINTPNIFSVIVAVLAGIVGVVSLTERRANALIGVFISVTTIPAAASVGVSAAYSSWSEAWGSLLQLLLNVVLLVVVGAVGLRAQRAIWRRRSSRMLARAALAAIHSGRMILTGPPAVRVGGMRAITVIPGKPGSVALTDMPEPPGEDGPVLVQTQAIGVCGTDLEIINGEYGAAPPGEDRLIIGHESLGRVIQAEPGSGFGAGDLVVGIVRRRDPDPCPACAAGDWDMCMNGRYTERGIMGRHGYASERYRIHPEHLVAVDPALGILGVLLEPATVVAKAWDHIEKIGRRATWAPQKVLVTGAGPIGLLAALLATQRGYQTYVLDLATEGRKPDMVRRLGATYFHRGNLGEAAAEADIVIECTGFVGMLLEVGPQHVRHRIICLTGVSAAGVETTVDPGQLNRNMVLQNSVLFGSVNANRYHYELAAQALAQADPGWLADLITRQEPLGQWAEAYTRQPDDIKTVLTFPDE